jgi:hypothetical protein
MDFRQWLITEEAIFLKNLLNTHHIVYLGKIGLWNVYSAILGPLTRYADEISPAGAPRIITAQEYKDFHGNSMSQQGRRTHGSFSPIKNPHIENFQKIKKYCEEATYLLARIGFPRYTTNMVIMDLSKEVNHITGGGVGGMAINKQHAFAVEMASLEYSATSFIRTVIHEHAHMWWANVLTKNSKDTFIKWYNDNVSNWITKPDNFTTYADAQTYDIDAIKKKIINELPKSGWSVFLDRLEHLTKMSLESYFKLRKAIDNKSESEMIEHAAMPVFGHMAECILRKDVAFNYGRTKTLSAGTQVTAERVNGGYFLVYYDPKDTDYSRKYETELISFDDLQKYAEFKLEILRDDRKERAIKGMAIGKKKHTAFLVPQDKPDEIRKIFDETAAYLFNYYARDQQGNHYEYDPRINSSLCNWFATWTSVIGRRGKNDKLHTPDDVKKAFVDVMNNKLYFPADMKPSNVQAQFHAKAHAIRSYISAPAGHKLRTMIQQQGVTPTDYAASNWDELWADTVEDLAMAGVSEIPGPTIQLLHLQHMGVKFKQQTSPELKKVLLTVLRGDSGEDSRNRRYAYHIPRRLARRKKPRT